jgi:hypothetical protein
LDKLEKSVESTRVLLVLTPDSERPHELAEIGNPMLAWASFSMLDQAIDELIADTTEIVSEREAFLMQELRVMLAEEGLVGSSKDVLVVPARRAWPQYEKAYAYVCQPNRPFQPVKRIAFYNSGKIEPLVPAILESRPAVRFERGLHDGWLGELVVRMLDMGFKEEGESYKVFRLSKPDEPNTLKLAHPIENDLTSESGRPVAFTQNQRYVSLEKLKKAKFTSELTAP